jgi:hypothetical protein
MSDRKLVIFTLVVSVLSLAILAKFAQVGMQVQDQAEAASKNPLGAVLGLFKKTS